MYGLSRKRYTRNPSWSFPGTILSRSLSLSPAKKICSSSSKRSAENVVIDSSPLWLRGNRFVNVIEASRVGRKRKAPQVAAGKHIGQGFPALDVQQFKCSGSFPSFFHFIQEQPSIRRNAKWFDCRVFSTTPFCGIDEKAVFSIRTFTHEDAGLFLAGKAFAKEIPLADFLDGVVGLHIQQFADAVTNLFAAWNRVQVCTCVLCLCLKPGASLHGVLIFEPTVRDRSQVTPCRISVTGFDRGIRRRLPSVWT